MIDLTLNWCEFLILKLTENVHWTDFFISISLKVDFATMTKNYEDAQIGTGASLEIESIRTAEAATSITKDTGKYQRMGQLLTHVM